MEQNSAHTSFWQTTDFMILATLALGFALEYFLPNTIPISFPTAFHIAAGATLLVIGIVVIILAKTEFKREEQPSAPGKPTTKIVTSGIFRWSRNPLYLGIILAVSGIGLSINNIWIVVLDIPLAITIHMILIIPEEKYLINIFGDQYLSYMNEVRRWI